MIVPAFQRENAAMLILDVSHDMDVSDIPLDPPSKGDFILKIPPLRVGRGVFFKMRIAGENEPV